MTQTIDEAAKPAIAMRELAEDDRDRLIEELPNVHDLRPVFEFRKKQIAIAESYRKPLEPSGPTTA